MVPILLWLLHGFAFDTYHGRCIEARNGRAHLDDGKICESILPRRRCQSRRAPSGNHREVVETIPNVNSPKSKRDRGAAGLPDRARNTDLRVRQIGSETAFPRGASDLAHANRLAKTNVSNISLLGTLSCIEHCGPNGKLKR